MLERPTLPHIVATRRDGSSVDIDLAIQPELRWFEGHFPMTPILPGVVQVAWALALGRDCFAIAQPAARCFQVKFKKVVRPDDRVTLTLTHDSGKHRLAFSFKRDGMVCSTGSIALTPP
jgi:3-hydroxymyristoyl/3-hydroxydecanoyl-(acyl carrier protein) dehydratase